MTWQTKHDAVVLAVKLKQGATGQRLMRLMTRHGCYCHRAKERGARQVNGEQRRSSSGEHGGAGSGLNPGCIAGSIFPFPDYHRRTPEAPSPTMAGGRWWTAGWASSGRSIWRRSAAAAPGSTGVAGSRLDPGRAAARCFTNRRSLLGSGNARPPPLDPPMPEAPLPTTAGFAGVKQTLDLETREQPGRYMAARIEQ